MFTQYFGHYLLNKEWVTASKLQKALEQLQSTHVKLGVLSVNAGYMSGAQAEEVHQKQTQMDKRFGEIAIDLGYLTDDQLNSLLNAQKESHLLLGQALIDQESLTLEQFSEALRQFKTDHYLSDEQFAAVQKGDIDVLINTMLQNGTETNLNSYSHYLALFAKNMIRFIDPHVYMEINSPPKIEECEWFISQEITGAMPFFTGLALKEDMLLPLASQFAEEAMETVDEMALASVSEFLNLHNGLFLVSMSNQGVELGLKPQEISQKLQPFAASAKYSISVHWARGFFELIIAEPVQA